MSQSLNIYQICQRQTNDITVMKDVLLILTKLILESVKIDFGWWQIPQRILKKY